MRNHPVQLRSETRNLPCHLTEDELRQRGDALAAGVQALAAEGARQADIKAQMKARLTELEARQTRVALSISRKEEYRDVECSLWANARSGLVEVVRVDTGETVETRAMTDEERQYALPLAPSEA